MLNKYIEGSLMTVEVSEGEIKITKATRFYKVEIPTLELHWMNTDGEQCTSYLQPFRKYCFQVSSNPEDGSDEGSSHAEFPYKHVFLTMDDTVAKHMLTGDAMTALAKFCRGRGTLPNVWGWNENTEIFRGFVNECYEWIMRS